MKSLTADQSLLSNFSKDFYGSIESTFGTITDHPLFLAEFICKNFNPSLKKDSLLDIGSGPGFILEQLLPHFQKVVAVDPNNYYLPYYEKLKTHPGFDYMIGNFENIDFFNQFSIILCSHILYHVPQQEWGPFISKILTLLEAKGHALITLVAPRGDFHKLCAKVNPNYSNSSVLCNILADLGISYKRTRVKAQYKESNKQKYANLVSMFAIDDCFLPSEYSALPESRRKEIELLIYDFIEMSYCENLNLYILNTEEEYIDIENISSIF